MRCEAAKRRLVLLLHEELPPKASVRTKDHLLKCSGCRAEFEEMRGIFRLLRWVGRVERERAQARARSEAAKSRTLELMRREFARQDAEAARRERERTSPPGSEAGDPSNPPL